LLKIIGVLFRRKCRSCVPALAAPASFLRTTPPLPQKKHKRDHEYAHDFEPLDLVTLQLEDECNHTQQPRNQGNHKRKQEKITPGHCDSPVRFPLITVCYFSRRATAARLLTSSRVAICQWWHNRMNFERLA
jgi:hypothetical protein